MESVDPSVFRGGDLRSDSHSTEIVWAVQNCVEIRLCQKVSLDTLSSTVILEDRAIAGAFISSTRPSILDAATATRTIVI